MIHIQAYTGPVLPMMNPSSRPFLLRDYHGKTIKMTEREEHRTGVNVHPATTGAGIWGDVTRVNKKRLRMMIYTSKKDLWLVFIIAGAGLALMGAAISQIMKRGMDDPAT